MLDERGFDFGPWSGADRRKDRPRRGFRTLRRGLAIAVVVAAVASLAPTRGEARPVQESPSTGIDFSESALVDISVEVASGESADVVDTLDSIKANVARQMADLTTADAALTTAQAELEAADQAVAATEERIAGLVADSDDVVTDTYVNPPTDAIIDTFAAESASDAMIKRAILSMRADKDAAALSAIQEARDDLEVERDVQAEEAADAQHSRSEKEAQLADLEAATSQQTDFVLAVSDRLGGKLAEAAGLAALDPEAAAELRSQQAELAAKLKEIADAEAYRKAVEYLQAEQARIEREQAEAAAAAQAAAEQAAAEAAAAAKPTIGPASGTLATVTCPAGLGSITIDSSIEAALQRMVDDAAAAGVNLCGGGYRSSDAQIELRKQNCGTTYYLIYEAPSSACSPPTARPGTSMHEKGLAIDFTCNGGGVIGSSSSPCFEWLAAYANDYGFHNLPSEPWHWSVNGN